jgi:predicted kinase
MLGKDAFKEALFDALGRGDADWSRRLSEAAFARQYAAASGILGGGRSLLLEGNFRASHHRALVALATRWGTGLAQVACRASLETLSARLAARAAHGLRHPGHADAPTPPDAAGLGLYAPLPIQPTVTFDADDPPALEALIRALGL